MNEEQLIKNIKQLKEIKPNKEWASLLKLQIINSKTQSSKEILEFGFWNLVGKWKLGFKISTKLAYSFAVFVFVIIGLIGFASYTVPGDLLFPVKKIAEQSQAAITGKAGLKQNVAVLNNRINELALVAKEGRTANISSAINEVKANVFEIAKTLKAGEAKNQETLNEIAISLKTLADVPGTDLTVDPDIKSFYQTVVESQIKDLEKSTLTESQQLSLDEIKELYEQQNYTQALEEILLINSK